MNPDATCRQCGAPVASDLGGTCLDCLWLGDDEADSGHEFGNEIARGGMGIIYQARQLHPEREVAAKMLLPHLLEHPGLRERFANEARVAAGLDHEGILPIYAVGEHQGLPFFTMKLADGGTLAERLANSGPMPARGAALLVARLADALAHAHTRGVLHRDLKPGNILFDSEGRAYISDFGIAKAIDSGTPDLTLTLAVMGTPRYLPPEIANGSMREASTAGDIYALGVILFELIHGAPPFNADSLPLVLRQISDSSPSFIPGLNPDLRAIIAMCLEKDPAHRYPTALALSTDLRAWIDGREVTARPASPARRLVLTIKRNPLASTLTAIILLGLLLGTLIQHRNNKKLSHSLAASLLSQASLISRDPAGNSRTLSLDLIRQAAPAADPVRLRSELASALSLPSLELTRRWTVPGEWNLVTPDFTPDLTHYLAPAPGGSFAIYDTTSQQPLGSFPSPETTDLPAGIFKINTPGNLASITWVDMEKRNSLTQVLDLTNSRFLGLFATSGIVGSSPVLFNDGSFLVQTSHGLRRGTSPENLTPFQLPPPPNGTLVPESLSLSHDGTRLAASLKAPAGIALWTLQNLTLEWQIPLPEIPQAIAWSQQDHQLAFANGSSAPVDLTILNATSGQHLATLPGHGAPVSRLAFHPDGHSLASLGFDGWLRWQDTTPGGFRTRLPANTGPLRFSPDGSRLAFSPSRGTLGIAQCARPIGWHRWPASHNPGTITCTEASRDGRHLVISTLDNLTLWDTQQRLATDTRPWPPKLPVRWPWFRVAPDGTYLVCSDSSVPMTRWPIGQNTFGTPITLTTTKDRNNIIHDIHPVTGEWLVSGDRLQREASRTANFFLWSNGDPDSSTLAARDVQANGLMFLPPGHDTLIGSQSHRNDAWLWDTQTATETRPLGHEEPVFLMVSPDGSRLCTIGSSEGRLWNTRDWSIIARWSQSDLGKTVPAFSPDSALFSIVTPSGTTVVRTSPDGSEFLTLRPPYDLHAPQSVWLSSERLLLVSPIDGIHEWNLAELKKQALQTSLPWQTIQQGVKETLLRQPALH